MRSEVMSQFPYPWLAVFALFIFLAVFAGVVFWAFTKRHRELFENLEKLPLEKEL